MYIISINHSIFCLVCSVFSWSEPFKKNCNFGKTHLKAWTHILILTHWGQGTPSGDIDLDQHWLRYWFVARWHQAITWSNVDLFLMRFHGIHLRAISNRATKPLFWPKNLPEVNELILRLVKMCPHIVSGESASHVYMNGSTAFKSITTSADLPEVTVVTEDRVTLGSNKMDSSHNY